VERVKALGIFAGGLMATGMTDGDGVSTPPGLRPGTYRVFADSGKPEVEMNLGAGSDSEQAVAEERKSMPSEVLKSALEKWPTIHRAENCGVLATDK
jgi:hypothetical protein